MSGNATAALRETVEAVYRSDSRRVFATLVRLLGDFDLAEDALHDAFTAALEQWTRGGVPANPRAWPRELRARELRATSVDNPLLETDWVKTGLAGALADYQLVDRNGNLVAARQIDYNGQPSGYTADPQEVISYIEAHDNDTLWDAIQAKAAPSDSLSDRVRTQNLGISLLGFGQGIPFYHAGVEMLRSKSMDRNSYNSGDWFNKLDFTYGSNNWGVGLPPAPDNQSSWPIQGPLLANPALKAGRPQILAAYTHFLETVAIRKSTPLFRLRTAADVQSRLRFYNTGPSQIPGVIVMSLADDNGGVDRAHKRVAVVFNATNQTKKLQHPRAPGRAADPPPPPEALARLDRASVELQQRARSLLHPRPHRGRLLGQPPRRRADPAPDPGCEQSCHRRSPHKRPR